MATWQALADELDRWFDSGAVATFWWRDDDAAVPTAQLGVLLRHAVGVPLTLAVIPAAATVELAARLRNEASVVVVQHGWQHTDHAMGGKSEYPASRSDADVAQELSDGRSLLAERFGRQFLPVFVPPWHSFDDRFLPLLPRHGIGWISRKGPRPTECASEGLRQANAHAAPIRWSIPPSFGDDAEHLSTIIDHLRGRRVRSYDLDEPTGILTHHLAQNDASYAFMRRLLNLTVEHPAAKWLGAREIFKP